MRVLLDITRRRQFAIYLRLRGCGADYWSISLDHSLEEFDFVSSTLSDPFLEIIFVIISSIHE